MILDTDVLIELDQKHAAADLWLKSVSAPLLVSGFAALELQQGCHNQAALRRVEQLLAPFTIAWPTREDLERARTQYALLRISQGLGIFDSLIASTAVGLGLPLATFNVKHFRHVPGLVLVQPYAR